MTESIIHKKRRTVHCSVILNARRSLRIDFRFRNNSLRNIYAFHTSNICFLVYTIYKVRMDIMNHKLWTQLPVATLSHIRRQSCFLRLLDGRQTISVQISNTYSSFESLNERSKASMSKQIRQSLQYWL